MSKLCDWDPPRFPDRLANEYLGTCSEPVGVVPAECLVFVGSLREDASQIAKGEAKRRSRLLDLERATVCSAAADFSGLP